MAGIIYINIMNRDQGNLSKQHISVWHDTNNDNSLLYSKLTENLTTDVVIVGGGIAGVTIAYNLSRQNLNVVLVEAGSIGSGETGRTTAHLVTALDDRYYELERIYGKEKTKLIHASHKEAIDFIEDTIKSENIDCDFLRLNGYLFQHPTDDDNSLEKEFNACKNAGLEVELKKGIPGTEFILKPCLEFKDQAQFHPLKYISGLCNAIKRNGGKIFTDTHAREISEEGIITDGDFKVNAKHVVVATNTPVNNKVVMHLKQYAYRTYVIGALIKKDYLPDALWWDTGNFDLNSDLAPYHYIRLQKYNEDFDLLICGGEDHPTGLPDADGKGISESNRYDLLEKWCRTFFPIKNIIYRWSGQVMEPMDCLAYIGHNPMDSKNIYIVTGDSGNGMTHGTISGLLIPDLILGRENKYEDIYSPSRFKIFKKGSVFFKEVAGGFVAYLKNKPDHPENENVYEIKTGEAKVVEIDKKKYGVFVDEKNELHFVSAECTHLKCIVNWNSDEKSWDCPCHGSRFDHLGNVLNGPANSPLKYYSEDEIIRD